MINFAIHLHNYWGSHLPLLAGHIAALVVLLGVWTQVSTKSTKAAVKTSPVKENAPRGLGEPLPVA